MRNIFLAPILMILVSCSIKDFNEENKTKLNHEKFEIAILDDSLLGVTRWEVDQDYGCTFSGVFKFNVEVPQGFTGIIEDSEAVFLIKGKEIKDVYYSKFIDGKQVEGTPLYEYVSNDKKLTKDGLLFCSVDSTDDIRLKTFSEKVLVLKGLKPSIK